MTCDKGNHKMTRMRHDREFKHCLMMCNSLRRNSDVDVGILLIDDHGQCLCYSNSGHGDCNITSPDTMETKFDNPVLYKMPPPEVGVLCIRPERFKPFHKLPLNRFN